MQYDLAYFENNFIIKASLPSKSPFYKSYIIASKNNPSKYLLKKVVTSTPKENIKIFTKEKYFEGNKYLNTIIGVFISDDQSTLTIISEYNPITLRTYLNKNKSRGKYLSQEEIINIFIQLCLAFKCLHDKKLNYRVLDPEHVYIKGDAHIKLIDAFEMKLLKDFPDSITVIGNDLYKCAENYLLRPYTCKSDIWSLGVILFELLSYKLPFSLNDLKELKILRKVDKGKIIRKLPKYCREDGNFNKHIITLLLKMLEIDTMLRPNITDVLKDVYRYFVRDNIKLKLNKYEWVSEMRKIFGNEKIMIIKHNYINPYFEKYENNKIQDFSKVIDYMRLGGKKGLRDYFKKINQKNTKNEDSEGINSIPVIEWVSEDKIDFSALKGNEFSNYEGSKLLEGNNNINHKEEDIHRKESCYLEPLKNKIKRNHSYVNKNHNMKCPSSQRDNNM